jgi:hypothetical protein
MKKFYALAMAAAAALSMNAQTLYVVGSGEGLAWTPETPYEVALANGKYTFSINDLTQFKISNVSGDWDTFNGGAYTCSYTEADLGNPVDLVQGDGNIGTPWKGDYTVVVAGDFSTITMTTTTEKPTGYTAVYLRGGMNEWGAPEEWQFTTEDGVNYSFTCSGDTKIAAEVEFKIADADWDKINYGAGGYVDVNDSMEWNYNDNNSKLAEDFEGTISFVLGEEKAPIEVTITAGNGVSSVSVDNNAAAEYFNLQGVRVANPENGLYIVRRGANVTKVYVK